MDDDLDLFQNLACRLLAVVIQARDVVKQLQPILFCKIILVVLNLRLMVNSVLWV